MVGAPPQNRLHSIGRSTTTNIVSSATFHSLFPKLITSTYDMSSWNARTIWDRDKDLSDNSGRCLCRRRSRRRGGKSREASHSLIESELPPPTRFRKRHSILKHSTPSHSTSSSSFGRSPPSKDMSRRQLSCDTKNCHWCKSTSFHVVFRLADLKHVATQR
jgi:hypothetical protein